ncbi:MAG: zinc ribbon domain-containing protein [Candidatus Electrothrix gigas]
MATKKFFCKQCGADLKFEPGTRFLKCPYCGAKHRITRSKKHRSRKHLAELSYSAYLEEAARQNLQEIRTVTCDSCGAETTLDPNITSTECPFCGTSMVVTLTSKKKIKPAALLPFRITLKKARELFRAWIKGLWFAPNALKKYARLESGIKGIYLPHWTYDCSTDTSYTGERGEYYYVTEEYTEEENGETVTKTREVRETHWYPASGRVRNIFDDVLVAASNSLDRSYVQELEPWDLGALKPYDDRYLSGFLSESYSVGLKQGFQLAKDIMAGEIDHTIRRDIGGDEQRIHNKNSHYSNITFKHILLPIWVSAYRYKGKVYRFLINARTGEVQGDRPWSWIKISFAVLVTVVIIGLGMYLAEIGNR